ncbi:MULTISPECIES: flavodoxin family protein [Agathobacter]|uniref:Flavodoxin family protein n=1 Tax=Agathobacter ruminis TaxID=1712665 RepID=A0A2G3E141_9FIRM|nr:MULTISPECIES: flavodoxin family protein [Agathobacter]MBQ1680990.1 flavodoxin family protein [Agathobacter sp.]MCR5677607.1 flavodoxin family protein [Agathobacter sp.]MDC7300186.1 flavodoxin family protein [Agathobacter ruminis]PHU36860.1 flavodoxin family protein [Agathobacter ruminis]
MKILGISLGTKNGNNDTMCRVALEAAREKGAEIEFIHLFDWDIRPCTGCVACSRSLVMGKGMVCTVKDDFHALYEKIIEADGVLFVDPIYESGASGLFHIITDRMGPGHDTGMMLMADGKLKEQGKEGLNPRYFRQKALSFVGIGGSDWAVRVETDHRMFALSPGWKVVNNEYFSWCKDVIMQDDKIARMQEIGRNLVDAAQDMIDKQMIIPGSEEYDPWQGKDGACPHCHGNAFYIFPGTDHVVCELCGLEGRLKLVDGAFRFENDPSIVPNGLPEHAHDILPGKMAHGQDIFENEGRLMDLFKDPEFQARKKHYTEVCEPTPSPSK